MKWLLDQTSDVCIRGSKIICFRYISTMSWYVLSAHSNSIFQTMFLIYWAASTIKIWSKKERKFKYKKKVFLVYKYVVCKVILEFSICCVVCSRKFLLSTFYFWFLFCFIPFTVSMLALTLRLHVLWCS